MRVRLTTWIREIAEEGAPGPMTRQSGGSANQSQAHLDRKWVAVVALYAALGLVAVAVADIGSRNGYTSTYVFFWQGLLLIFVPICLVVLRKDADRRERLVYLVLLGVVLYLVKILGWPDGFAFTDEFIHLRNAQDILRTGHLFESNPLLPTAAYYPGLAAITTGFVQLSGLSPFASGLLVIGAARVVFCASFFLVAEKVTGSSRAAAAAGLVYVANPMFLYWGAAFAYENLALPLAAFSLWWLGRTRHDPSRLGQLATVIVIVAVCITHHIVGFALAGLLGAWWLAELFIHRDPSMTDVADRAARRLLGVMAVVAGATSLGWLLLVARPAVEYLIVNNIVPAIQQTVEVILGHIPSRRLYSSGGYASAPWEILAGVAAVGLLLGSIPVALYRAWDRRDYAPMAVAMVVAAAYPLSLAPRLAPNGVAISGRLSEYVYAGVACVVGLLIVGSARRRLSLGEHGSRAPALAGWQRTAVATGFVTVLFIGNVTIGTAFYQRLPESSRPAGYPWSVQSDVISASIWAHEHLGNDQPFGANAIDVLALATYGGQQTIPQDDVWPIFFAEEMDESVVGQIKATGLHYLLVDWRMTKGVPPTPGYYFSPQEPHAGEYKQSFSSGALQKFYSDACARLVYDSQPIAIFDVSQIQDGSCRPVANRAGQNEKTPG